MADVSATLQPFPVDYTLLHIDIPAVTIILGQVRVTVAGPDDQARFGTRGQVEWSAAYQMPLPTAKHLLRQLANAIENYERQWGPIPMVVLAEPEKDNVAPLRPVTVVPGEPRPLSHEEMVARLTRPADPEPPEPAA